MRISSPSRGMSSPAEGTCCIRIWPPARRWPWWGAYVASELFGSPEKALGEKIKLNGDNYTVVGVVEQQTESAADFDDGCTDDFVWIPLFPGGQDRQERRHKQLYLYLL